MDTARGSRLSQLGFDVYRPADRASQVGTLDANAAPDAVDDVFNLHGLSLVVAAPGFLANDTDADGDPITATSITDGVDHGTLTAFADGSFTYTPNPGFIGADSFRYSISDGLGGTDEATVTINVVNAAPDAVDDVFNLHGTSLTITPPGFLANDTDADGDPINATAITDSPDNGVLTAFADGSFVYTPTPGFIGADSFRYRISDGFGGADEATVTINVVNAAPDAVDDVFNLHGTSLTITPPGFLANDTDADGDPINATAITDSPDNGVLTAFADGSFVYTPTPGFIGADSFRYSISDGLGGTDEATVTINVVNAAPDAVDDVFNLHGTSLTITPPGFLANDTDADGDPINATAITDSPDNGVLTAFADGSFVYTPTPGFIGADSFRYRISDGFGGADEATVTINVVNAAPDAVDDVFNLHGTSLTITPPGFLANDTDADGDPFQATSIVDSPDNGTLTAFADGSFTYTPNPGFVGSDSFAYRIQDSLGATDDATVTINVVNAAPDAVDDAFDVDAGATLTIIPPGFLANDSDPDGDPFQATSIVDSPDNGTLTAFADGSFTYTPNPGFAGIDSFAYRIQDSLGATDDATVTINVLNDPPDAVDDAYNATYGIADGSVNLLANDSDPDGEAMTITGFTAAANGTLAVEADGTFSYTPNAGFYGVDTFSYTISDPYGQTDTATVSLTVFQIETETLGNVALTGNQQAGSWAAFWTDERVALEHTNNYSAGEWSDVKLTTANPDKLKGGDLYQGDLGVSGRSVRTSANPQELDGAESLRFELEDTAVAVRVEVSSFFLNDDGSLYAEAGLLRVRDADGNVVGETAFRANGAGGPQSVSLVATGGFVAVELLAGAYDGTDFVFGAYANADGSFGSGVYLDAAGRHGSDFLVDAIEFDFVGLDGPQPASAVADYA